jgi:hypothetical protein
VAGKAGQVDAPPLAFESQFETMMQRAFRLHPRAHAGFSEQIHRALLEHTCSDGRFDLLAAARFQHDGLDAAKMKKMGKKQTCRPGTDDANLSAHECLLDAAIDLAQVCRSSAVSRNAI